MQFEQQLSAPIKSIDEIVRVSTDTGREYHVARLEDTLKGNVLTTGGAITIAAETVKQYGADKLIGKKVKRFVRIDAD